MLKYPMHDSFAHFMEDLSKLYLATPALSAGDYNQNGFQWIDCHQEEKCVYAFERSVGTKADGEGNGDATTKNGAEDKVIAVFNFSDYEQTYWLPVSEHCKELKLLLSSENEIYSGSVHYEKNTTYPVINGVVELRLPAFSGMYLGE